MAQLLQILSSWLVFFFEKGEYRITDSVVSRSFGNAKILVSSDTLEWQLVRERSRVVLECRPVRQKLSSWYSLGLLIRQFGGGGADGDELTEDQAAWLAENLAKVEIGFGEACCEETIAGLEAQKIHRANEYFGD